MHESLKFICNSILNPEESGHQWSEPQRDVARILLGMRPVSEIMQGVTAKELIGDTCKYDMDMVMAAAMIAGSGVSAASAARIARELRYEFRKS